MYSIRCLISACFYCKSNAIWAAGWAPDAGNTVSGHPSLQRPGTPTPRGGWGGWMASREGEGKGAGVGYVEGEAGCCWFDSQGRKAREGAVVIAERRSKGFQIDNSPVRLLQFTNNANNANKHNYANITNNSNNTKNYVSSIQI